MMGYYSEIKVKELRVQDSYLTRKGRITCTLHRYINTLMFQHKVFILL